MRKFEELVTEIEHDGERFVPIEVIARLAVQLWGDERKLKIIKSTSKTNKWYKVVPKMRGKYYDEFRINEWGTSLDLDNMKFYVNDYNDGTKISWIVYNTFQIVKNLIKWGFIEP